MRSYIRYLAAKKRIDDRSLNRWVWRALRESLGESSAHTSLRVLEIGAGIGTMVTRLVDWDLITHARYTAVDLQGDLLTAARRRLSRWAEKRGMEVVQPASDHLHLRDDAHSVRLQFHAANLFDFLPQEDDGAAWDLLIAHAVLDLVDLDRALPLMKKAVRPGGWLYFTLNFDGLTVFEPAVDEALDSRIIELYHRSMDARRVSGQPSGDSRTGRHLLRLLGQVGLHIQAAGSSDWVVYPREGSYPLAERFFLHHILQTILDELEGHPGIEPDQLIQWIAARREQIEKGELIFIAHQLDVLAHQPISGAEG